MYTKQIISLIMKSFKQQIQDALSEVLKPGTEITVVHKGKRVKRKVVRHAEERKGSPYYVVDIGQRTSIEVPDYKINECKQQMLEDFESDFMTTLKKMKKPQFDLDDEDQDEQHKQNLELFVKILNSHQDMVIPEKVYYKLAGKLFPKQEAKRILNHFIRRKVIKGTYEGSSSLELLVLRTITKKDYLNFY